MYSITVWILIAYSSYISVSPVVISKFKDEKSCMAASVILEKKSEEKKGMRPLVSICVPADGVIQ